MTAVHPQQPVALSSETPLFHTPVPTHLPSGEWSEQARQILAERYLLKDEQGTVIETPDERIWAVALHIAEAEQRYGNPTLQGRKVAEYTLAPQPYTEGFSPALSGRIYQYHMIAEDFYRMMVEQKFLPNTPTLANAGKHNGHQFSGCYVLPVEDSLAGIFDTLKHMALVHASGGGTGFSFSRIRPRNSRVKTTQGVASGPVSFMRVYDAATNEIKQGGMRRGANMGILRVDHPDILEFIDSKRLGGIENFNISVGITDAFWAALQGEGPDGGEVGRFYYSLVNPQTQRVTARMDARQVWQRICAAAWETGDPGLVFLDRINRSTANPTPALVTIEATNPCGEQPLGPNDVCNLGSINLAKFVQPNQHIWGQYTDPGQDIDWIALERVTRLAVRFLDDVIDMNPFPTPEIAETARANRRVGLGVMGWADLLFALGIPYGSEEAVELGGKVMAFINDIGHSETYILGQERGAFPNFSQSRYADGPARRNATVTTIAPTGTISIIAGCSSGIEPAFALVYRHIVKQPDGERNMLFVNPALQAWAERTWGPLAGTYAEEVARNGGRMMGPGESLFIVDDQTCQVFTTALEIAPDWHIAHQAAFQAHTDNGVSKTINLPKETTAEQIADIYRRAYDMGCLGITVFRKGSKGGAAVLHAGDGDSEASPTAEAEPKPITVTFQGRTYISRNMFTTPNDDASAPIRVMERNDTYLTAYAQDEAAGLDIMDMVLHAGDRPRHRMEESRTYRTQTPLGTAYVNVTRDEAGPKELFLNVGKAGSETAAVSEALGRLVSLILRMPSPRPPQERLQQVIDQLLGIGGGRPLGMGPDRVHSLPDAIGQVLREELDFLDIEANPRDCGDQEAGPFASDGLHHRLDRAMKLAASGQQEAAKQALNGHYDPMERIRPAADLCPSCGHATLVREEGCQKCYSCAYSEC